MHADPGPAVFLIAPEGGELQPLAGVKNACGLSWLDDHRLAVSTGATCPNVPQVELFDLDTGERVKLDVSASRFAFAPE